MKSIRYLHVTLQPCFVQTKLVKCGTVKPTRKTENVIIMCKQGSLYKPYNALTCASKEVGTPGEPAFPFLAACSSSDRLVSNVFRCLNCLVLLLPASSYVKIKPDVKETNVQADGKAFVSTTV